MTVPLRVELHDSRAERKFARLNHLFANFRPVMAGPVRTLVRKAVIEQFRTRGRWGGSEWQELAESTIARKRAAGVLRKGPLKFTSKLYASLTVIGHPLRRERITKQGYTLRSMRRSRKGFPIGAAHQTGTSDGHVPQREIFPQPMPASFIRELRSVVRGYLVEGAFGRAR